LENTCTFDCTKLTCRTNQVCDSKLERCVCPQSYRFCDNQAKCIPEDHCCSRFDCGIDEKCIKTVNSAELCLEGDGRACKLFDTTRDKVLNLNNKEFRIKLENFEYTNKVSVLVNENKYELISDSGTNLGDGFILKIKKIRETGGSCIDFDLDKND
ncbi:MAG: hypothetical protein IH912_05870, partial [Proteobacteria bacterium]|nr:hypothetical protein [Pseudomonadota bacterium]